LRLLLLGTVLGLLAMPFLQDVLNAGAMPPRTLVAAPILIAFLAMLALSARARWLNAAAVVLSLVAALQITGAAVAMHAAGELARKHDEALAVQLYQRIVAVAPQRKPGVPIAVDFFGAKKFETAFPRPAWSTAGYSFFEWDGGNEGRMLNYMHLLGYTDLVAASEAQRQQNLTTARLMPAWPAEGSVRWQNDAAFVRLGAEPGWPYKQ
jgi:hypothetical protein